MTKLNAEKATLLPLWSKPELKTAAVSEQTQLTVLGPTPDLLLTANLIVDLPPIINSLPV